MKSKKQTTKKVNTKTEKPRPVVKDGDDKCDDKPFDFGGLPSRDLKKNLGCG